MDDLVVDTLGVAYPPEPLATWLADGRYLPRGVPPRRTTVETRE